MMQSLLVRERYLQERLSNSYLSISEKTHFCNGDKSRHMELYLDYHPILEIQNFYPDLKNGNGKIMSSIVKPLILSLQGNEKDASKNLITLNFHYSWH